MSNPNPLNYLFDLFVVVRCAYRLVAEGIDLPSWHHLLSGSEYLVQSSGASIMGRVISETHVKDQDLENHIIRWVD